MMTQPAKIKSSNSLVIGTSVVIAITIMGDSLMYSLLPLEAESIGIPITLVGLLLSINRIVRLVTNTWAGLIYEKFGTRRPFILAILIAFITTLLYGVGWGFVTFLLARAGWGFAWSLFRQGSYISIWAANKESRGKLTGLLWGIIRLGSAISVFLGGYLYDRFGFSTAVFAVAGIALFSLPIAFKLPWPNNGINKKIAEEKNQSLGWKSVLKEKSKSWLLVVGFSGTFFDSIVVSTASLFLAKNLSEELGSYGLALGTTAGLLLGLRFSANIIFGPIIGALSDKLGHTKTLSWLSLLILVGLSGAIFLKSFWVPLSIALVFISSSGIYVTGNTSASKEGEQTNRPQLFISFYSTAIDAGSAVGPLFVYSSALILQSLSWIYLATSLMLFIVIQRYYLLEKRNLIVIT